MGYLYRLDFANGKSYIGITTRSAPIRYNAHRMAAEGGSKLAVHCAWRKHGAPTVAVMAVLENEDLGPTEIRAIREFETLYPRGYNLTHGGDISPMCNPAISAKLKGNKHGLGCRPSAETRARLSAAAKGRVKSPETRAKLSAAHTGRKRSAESIAKVALAKTGSVASAETRAKMSAAHAGHQVSIETREKIRAALSGRPLTEETKAKLSAANKGQGAGRVFSAETRAKLSAAAKIREQAKREAAAR